MQSKFSTLMRRFRADEDGSFILEFAITFPLLIMLSFGLLEFSLVVYDYQRAAEATRAGVRFTIVSPPIPNTAQILAGDVITCTNTTGTVDCDTATESVDADASFQALLVQMQGIYPTLTAENIIVIYSGTDVGDADTSGGLLPLVTLKLTGVRHDMIVGHLIGVDTIEFPSFTTTILGPGQFVNVAPLAKGGGKSK